MKKNNKKEVKKIKIGPINIRRDILIDICCCIVILIILFASPKQALIVTQKYNSGTEEQNNSVLVTFGNDNTEERFKLYFWWYNVIHEVGHGVVYYNGNKKLSGPEEEQLVNDFAYAYWSYYGEQEKLDRVEEIINYAYDHIQNEEGRSMDYMEYARKNWNKNSFYTFDKYGYFQFSSVKETYKNKKDLKTVLQEMGVKKFDLSKTKKLHYKDTIDKEECNDILYNAIDNVREWGLEFPNTYHKYITNPYYSYFTGNRKIVMDIKLLIDRSLSD